MRSTLTAGMREICQSKLPLVPWMDARTSRLPGLNPVNPGDWLRLDEVYADQMAYREALLREHRDNVYQVSQQAKPAAEELLQVIVAELDSMSGFTFGAGNILCPDGREVKIDRNNPLLTAARLVQEDLCIMEKTGDEHRLTAAALCFPASWMLAEKFLQPLTHIHDPVPNYTAEIANRVQRLFDLIKVDRPMWRANYLIYADPDLHQPRSVSDRRKVSPSDRRWMRVERQCLVRLPKTGAVVFTIHSYVVPLESLSATQLRELPAGIRSGNAGIH